MAEPVLERIIVQASAEELYDLISDVSRMGEWSPEATGARGAGARLAVGDRFVGMNRRALAVWWTNCTVRKADRGRSFEFDVDFGPLPISRWTYDFLPQADGSTLVTETWLDRRAEGLAGLPLRAVGQIVIPGDRARHNRANMRVTLKRLRATAEAGRG